LGYGANECHTTLQQHSNTASNKSKHAHMHGPIYVHFL
jgi:hypothetical protein